MDKYGVRKEFDYDGKHHVNTILSWVSLEQAEKLINEEMESYKRTLEHINKTLTLTLFKYDNYTSKDIYTKTVKELLS